MNDSCVFLWTLDPSDCASWVQAWGTIGALAVSIGVWIWQSSRAHKERVQAEIDRLTERTAPAMGLLNGLLQALDSIVALAQAEIDRVPTRPFKRAAKDEISKFRTLLDEYLKVETHTFPDADLALQAAQAKEVGSQVLNLLATFDTHGASDSMVISSKFVTRLVELRKALLECRQEILGKVIEGEMRIRKPDLKGSVSVTV